MTEKEKDFSQLLDEVPEYPAVLMIRMRQGVDKFILDTLSDPGVPDYIAVYALSTALTESVVALVKSFAPVSNLSLVARFNDLYRATMNDDAAIMRAREIYTEAVARHNGGMN